MTQMVGGIEGGNDALLLGHRWEWNHKTCKCIVTTQPAGGGRAAAAVAATAAGLVHERTVDRLTREEILTVYRAGPEAVVALVEGLVRRLTAVEGRVAALEDRLALDSHNSSKPPSSDRGRPKPAPRSLRPAPGTTGRTTGGQPGHPGTTLRLVAAPDRLALHRPAQCAACGAGQIG